MMFYLCAHSNQLVINIIICFYFKIQHHFEIAIQIYGNTKD